MPLTSAALGASDVDRILDGSNYTPGTTAGLHAGLLALVHCELGATPTPATGHTLARWQLLAAVAARDVALVKLVEGHLDALAIIAETGTHGVTEPGQTWGTWAAEPPDAQVIATPGAAAGSLHLQGRKAWCSGASVLSHGLLTARGPRGEHWLAAVSMHQPGVLVEPSGWNAVGMAATRSVGVNFDGAAATLVGGDGAYLGRPGFWHGGSGIAACWWGAAQGVADPLRAAVASAEQRRDPNPHAAAHLGAVEASLGATAALLRAAAVAIDGHPMAPADAQRWAGLTRASAEATVSLVLDRVGRATGAGPLCLDADHARRVADLTVFVRQSHAERDLAELGRLAAARRWGL